MEGGSPKDKSEHKTGCLLTSGYVKPHHREAQCWTSPGKRRLEALLGDRCTFVCAIIFLDY